LPVRALSRLLELAAAKRRIRQLETELAVSRYQRLAADATRGALCRGYNPHLYMWLLRRHVPRMCHLVEKRT